jgi:hypothetical protein
MGNVPFLITKRAMQSAVLQASHCRQFEAQHVKVHNTTPTPSF